MDHDKIGRRVVSAVGEPGARELLDAEWLVELLINLEEDGPAGSGWWRGAKAANPM